MVELLSRKDLSLSPSASQLLANDEIIVIVDDSPEIVLLLEHYLTRQGLPIAKATNGEELYQIINTKQVALILLDIGLPGKSGTEILADLAPQYPDLGIVMVTGTIDIQIALDCLRQGADDYLTKPVNPQEFNHTLHQTLKKRRLAIDNRIFQKELEISHFRMQFLHTLNLKMNTAYLSALELNSVLQTILAGITSEDGLKFNRAFLALFDEDETTLCGKLAIGPSSKEDAGRLWHDIKEKKLGLPAILNGIVEDGIETDTAVNRIVQSLSIPITETDHILIHACKERKTLVVREGKAAGSHVPADLIELLGEQNFIVVPLFSPSKSLGVIIADNFITGSMITNDDVTALEIFASQASLAIEHSHLYQDMAIKIEELELVTQELEKNKDMLIEAERYSTLGYISAQLVHAIRNPITSIGGTARLLTKRVNDPKLQIFLDIMTEEAAKIESTLTDLFDFVEDIALTTNLESINTILRECVAIFYGTFKKHKINHQLTIQDSEILLDIDSRKIRQVFMHLIRNSVEAMPNGGTLRIELFEDENRVTIIITDSGTGVTDSNVEVVTDPFFTTKTYGTGLGLSLVEQILDLHKANFSLQQLTPSGMKATILFEKSNT